MPTYTTTQGPCQFCGAYSSRSCEMRDEMDGTCPWEESEPDPDLLLENDRERRRLEKEPKP